MRGERFGFFVAILALACVGVTAWRFFRPLYAHAPQHATQANAEPHFEPGAELGSIKRELCRIGRAEQAFFQSTGHYADENELRLTGDKSLLSIVGPYHVAIRVPTPHEFVVVATAY